MTESQIQAAIRLAIGKLRHVRLFRNNTGVAHHADGSRVVYGLCPGSPDLIGFTSIVVTPDLVGAKVAVFTAGEVKTTRGTAKEAQENFLRVVREAGGIAGVVRSPADAVALILAAPGKPAR